MTPCRHDFPTIGGCRRRVHHEEFFRIDSAQVEEQAMVDRAGTFRIFWSIVPMARPSIVTITQSCRSRDAWNELSHFIISTQSPSMARTKGVTLASGQLGQGNQYPLKLAAGDDCSGRRAVLYFPKRRTARSRDDRPSTDDDKGALCPQTLVAAMASRQTAAYGRTMAPLMEVR